MAGEKEWFNWNNWQPDFLEKRWGLKISFLGEDLSSSSALGVAYLCQNMFSHYISGKEENKKRGTSETWLLTLDFLIIY